MDSLSLTVTGVGLVVIGAGFGIGKELIKRGSWVNGTSTGLDGKIQTVMLVAAALIEGLALFEYGNRFN